MAEKSNQTTISYGDEIKDWVDGYTDQYETSKAAAFRYAVRQQLQREHTTEGDAE